MKDDRPTKTQSNHGELRYFNTKKLRKICEVIKESEIVENGVEGGGKGEIVEKSFKKSKLSLAINIYHSLTASNKTVFSPKIQLSTVHIKETVF